MVAMESQLKKKGRQIREWNNDFEPIRYDQQQSELAPCPVCDEKGSLTAPRAHTPHTSSATAVTAIILVTFTKFSVI